MRPIQFPERGVGSLYRFERGSGPGIKIGDARGKVLAPSDAPLLLQVERGALGDGKWLGQLPPNAFEGLALRGVEDPDALATLPHLTGLRSLYLGYALLGGTALVHIGRMPWLEELDICAAWGISDDIHHLRPLGRLARLGLYETSTNDEGLRHLERMDLTHLDLGYTEVTDAGLPRLAHLTRLEELILSENAISDGGVDWLARLRSLRLLNIRRTRISAAGIARLGAALPACSFT